MKVTSTNIGAKQTIEYNGKSIETGIYKYPVNEPIFLGKIDVDGDAVIDRKYHGGEDKACYLYSADHYAVWKSKYPDLEWQWGMFGENLTIQGLDESDINIGDIFELGTAKVQITQPRQPCFKLGVRLNNPNAVRDFIHLEFPGTYIRVLESGKVSKGDNMILIEKKKDNFSLKQIFHLIYNAQVNLSQVSKAIQNAELADSCRNDLIKYARLKDVL